MTKNISIIITVALMTLSSGCSTYNSLVPSFATIGSSSGYEKRENSKTAEEMAVIRLNYENAVNKVIEAKKALTIAKEAYNFNLDGSTWWNPFSWI